MKNLKPILTSCLTPHLLMLLLGLLYFAWLQSCYKYHFFYQEQNQLFLLTPDWWLTYFSRPAWTACLVGDWLTQFYYYLYAGPSILAMCLLLVGESVRKALMQARLDNLPATAIAIIAMTIEVLFSLHYGYRLSSILCVCGGAAMFSLCHLRRWPKVWAEAIADAVGGILSFWMFGYGMLVFMLLVVVKGRVVCYASLLATLCLVPLTKRVFLLDYPALFTYPGIGTFVKPETALEDFFEVDNEYYFGNYSKVAAIVESKTAPSQYDLFYYNLVMAQRYRLPEVLMKYPSNYLGTFETVGPSTPTLTLKCINELYWLLGDMTFAERAAMLSMVSSPANRNIRMVKRLAEINVVSGDTLAARKYLRLLQHTFVWRRWASDMLSALSQPGNHQGVMKEYAGKANFINRADTLRLSDNAYVIMHELLESNPKNRVALDYLLCSDLLLKDIATFKRDYDQFALRPENAEAMSATKIYQEALMIYLAGTHAPEDEWRKYIVRQDVIRRFADYNCRRGDASFRDTYWYYFDMTKRRKS